MELYVFREKGKRTIIAVIRTRDKKWLIKNITHVTKTNFNYSSEKNNIKNKNTKLISTPR